MHLPLRLRTIGDLIKDGETVADIGADHGLLELYLIARHPDIKLLAIENKKGPYQNLKNTLFCLKNVRLSYSDGLTAIDKTITTLILAGMGGLNIKNIIDIAPLKLKRVSKIIIDAHRDQDIARKTIVSYGYKISQEIIVYEEEKYYVISEFIKSDEIPSYNEDELEIGYKLYEDKLWPNYKEYLIQKNQNIIDEIKDNPSMQDKVLELNKMNERLENYGKN